MIMKNKKQKTRLRSQYLGCQMGKNMKYHYHQKLLNQVEKGIMLKCHHLSVKTRYMAVKYRYGKREIEIKTKIAKIFKMNK
jgi:hypothetical protein